MKFWEIYRFEIGRQVQSISFWIYVTVLLAFPLLMNALTTPGDGVYPNNTFHIISVTVIGIFIWLAMSAPIAGEAASIDVETQMNLLTYTTPIAKSSYLGGRVLAAFTLNALLILILPLGTLLSFSLGLDEGPLLPFRTTVYLHVYFVVALPAAFVSTVLQFYCSLITGKPRTSYVASLLLAIFPLILASAFARLFNNWDLLKLMDPIGVAGIIGGELSTWTPIEKNTRLISIEGMFLINRIAWISLSVLFLCLGYLRFNFVYGTAANRRSRYKTVSNTSIELSEESAKPRSWPLHAQEIKQKFAFKTNSLQTLRIGYECCRAMMKSAVGIPLVVIISVISVVFGSRIISELGIPLIPTTARVLAYLIASPWSITTPWVVIPLLIMYFAGQLVWRERELRVNEIIDAAPITEWTILAGKFLGLSFMIIAWVAILMICGIAMQLTLNYYHFELGVYCKALFGLQLIEYLLFAMLALTIHVVVNKKNIGYVVVFLVFLFISFHAAFKVEHNMLVYASGPGWSYSDIRGFGFTIAPWLWFKLYWIAGALLVAVAAKLLWTRGKERGLKHRLSQCAPRFTPLTARITMTGFVLMLVTGSFIFYNTNIIHDYLSSDDINSRKAQYELLYGKYRNTPQPQLTGMKLNVDIFPDTQRVNVDATYTVMNNTSLAIDSIHLGSISTITLHEVKFNRPVLNAVTDKELCHYIYILKEPLLPGDSLQMTFTVTYLERGFRNDGTDELVSENGTYITNYDLLPVIGYRAYKEINDAVTRKKYGLPARPAIPSLFDTQARTKPMNADRNNFEAIVSTAKDQLAVAPGSLLRSWSKGERRYFHYRTSAPIRGEFAFFSANYKMEQITWNDMTIYLYHSPVHTRNVDKILNSVKSSLQYYTAQFGDYPYQHLTIVERAGDGGGASAEASIINYGERYSIMNPDESAEGFDLPYYIIAHEVAHQWFGSAQLTPANVEGAGVLIEGLAVYAGIQVLQNNYGEGHLHRYIQFLHSFYEMPRSLATNTLLQANESFLYYRKGGLAMHVLSKYIGKQKVNGALNHMLQKHKTGKLLSPTMLDLYKEIKAVTPDSLNYLLRDLFETNTYWRLKTKQVDVKKLNEDNWRVTLNVQAQKMVVDIAGKENEVEMSDWLEVGIFDETKGKPEPMYLKMHRIHSGKQTIEINVPRKPVRAGIDPNYLMIDLRVDDNVIVLEE